MRRLGWQRIGPVLVLTLVLVGRGGAQQMSAAPQDEERARAAHLLSRATWGVRAGDVSAVLEVGLLQWLERQLDPERVADGDIAVRLAAYPTTTYPMSQLLRDFSPQAQQAQRAAAMRDSAGGQRMMEQMTPEQRREQQMRSPQRLAADLIGAKIVRAVYTERQLEDVMADFWFNHFNVFFGKGQDRYFLADYERNAIRPHVFGRFEDMLIATAQHPAMLFYLDNAQSVYVDSTRLPQRQGPDLAQLARRIRSMTDEQKDELVRSGRITREMLRELESGNVPSMAPELQQRAQNRGLNENYARELMELHTLGVDGGYTQADVIAVARAFTGWTFERPNQREQELRQQMQRPARGLAGRGGVGRAGLGRGGQAQNQPIYGDGDVPFVFRPQLHDPHEKIVLGHRLAPNRGLEDGFDVIRMLSRHPSTARHIATKLVERFVSDEPPPDLVAHLADVFLKTDGDLRAVTRALFTADAFYRPEYRNVKVKTPYELVVSALRVTRAEVGPSRRVIETLRTMGHLPYNEPAPTGYPAMSEDWVNTGAMLNRMNFGLDLAAGRVDGVRLNGAALAGSGARRRPAEGAAPLDALIAMIVPDAQATGLAERIRSDLQAQAEQAPRAQAVRALGLALGSPEFQRR